MEDTEKSKRKKYRIELLHIETLEKKVSFETSILSIILTLFLSVLAIMGATIALVAFTPLKEYMPGYADANLNRQIKALSLQADSITEQMRQKDLYLSNIINILQGNDTCYRPTDPGNGLSVLPSTNIDTSSAISEKDSLLRAEYDSYKYSLSSITPTKGGAPIPNFYPPLNGTITTKFSKEKAHLGIDITAPDNEIVKSALEGTVIIATWSSENNYLIVIQHANNYLSLYRQNSALIKKEGDFVRAGEPIAIIGKSRTAPNQNSLHFEIWHNGTATDPEELISFSNNNQ